MLLRSTIKILSKSKLNAIYKNVFITKKNFSFFSGSNANYIEDMYEQWKKDNNSVHKSWDLFFKAADKGFDLNEYYRPPPSWAFNPNSSIPSNPPISPHNSAVFSPNYNEQLAVDGLISSFQTYGHIVADLNPIKSNDGNDDRLKLSYWGLNETHLNKIFKLPPTTFIGTSQNGHMTLKEIIDRLSEIYTKKIAIEYSHIEDEERVNWLKKRIESEEAFKLSKDDKIRTLERITKATLFEAFLAKKYPAEKRFGLEGCEVLISSLKEIIDTLSLAGADSFVFGMAHRGRLNVLANVCGQSNEHIFARFNDELQSDDGGSSDVKYHLGISRMHFNMKNKQYVNLSLVANPSHLESVDPVVKGKVKGEQFLRNDNTGDKVVCVLIHGDAAFSGQGIVYETIQLSELPSYTVHGTIHVVTNNQIGFTTEPKFSRSTRYCTDVAKMVNAPIFHVNGDDPEAVAIVSRISAEYRNRFKKDVFIDLIGYRRNGHNEGDNPLFTQPTLYQKISSHPNVMELFSKKMVDEGAITQEIAKAMGDSYIKLLENDFNKAQGATTLTNNVWIDSPWKDFFCKETTFQKKSTGFSKDLIKSFQTLSSKVPQSFNIHPQLKRVFNQREELLRKNEMDWAMGEIAAISSLLYEGKHVRITGQDVQRGTFSHRHHLLHDCKNQESVYIPLNYLDDNQAKYTISNSPLSEYSVMGFEHGYSMTSPNLLAIWEAQFGDFFNTAQCIVDQFISSGEDKWIRQSGMVMLLPHGYDGMGPEHSSARLERFLQLTKEDPDVFPCYDSETYDIKQLYNCNYIVAYPTTPANLFHLLRRQLSLGFRKPLVVMSPKVLLRLEMARSSFDEIDVGTYFSRIIPDRFSNSTNLKNVKRLIFCSGKIYYELFKARAAKHLEAKIAICRIEQLSPFPFDLVSQEINKYSNAELMYVQEEPKNQGAYYHVKPMIELCSQHSKRVSYVGRSVSASPATGNKCQHNIEQTSLIEKSLQI